ncbi:hypothetical protein [Hoeflea sp.]|uniref:hypothetical protein n=1 Tax=Hoeflea sp. TaxID=1940281 RepID=UPI003B027156
MPPESATLQPQLADLADLEKAISGPAAPLEDTPLNIDEPAPAPQASTLGSVHANDLRDSLLKKSPHRATLLKKSETPPVGK